MLVRGLINYSQGYRAHNLTQHNQSSICFAARFVPGHAGARLPHSLSMGGSDGKGGRAGRPREETTDERYGIGVTVDGYGRDGKRSEATDERHDRLR